jgi:ADP-ribose pyrophosphatase
MSDQVEKLVSRESIYNGRVLKITKDTIEMPGGKPATREVVHHPGAVAIVALNHEGKLLMVRQFRYATGRSLLEIPAGTLNPGEDPDVCAVRELQEETGYKPGHLEKLGGIFPAPGYTSEFIHLYIATDLTESRLEMDEDELIEVETYTLPEVFAKIQSAEIADAKSICGILLARERLTK